MNSPDGDKTAEAQVAYLIDVVTRNRESRCAELHEQARAQAQLVLKEAHAAVRAHMHEHVVALREKQRQRIAAARARNETAIRLRHQRASRAMTDRAWPLLRDSLASRWSNTATRQLWIEAAMDCAVRTLRSKDWRIEHPPSWPQHEIAPLRKRIQMLTGQEPTFAAYEDIHAGLRFIGGGATVDASINGLLQLRRRIEAQLLARLNPVDNGAGPAAGGSADG